MLKIIIIITIITIIILSKGNQMISSAKVYTKLHESTFAKLMLLRRLVLVVHDSVIALSATAYKVNNNLDEVLLVIVCAVYSGNIITRSSLVLKVAFTRAFVAFGSSVLVQRQAGSHA